MSNNNVIYSKTLELRSNNRGDCSLESFRGAGNKMGGKGIDQQKSGEEKAIENLLFNFVAPKVIKCIL